MSNLLGIVAPIRKFLSNSDESVFVDVDGNEKEIIALKQGREYYIPDFQREIRWEEENVLLLIEDLFSGPKYLGNVILTKHSDAKYSIIDGQQRITIITMLLTSIKFLHGENIDCIAPCKLNIESFDMFSHIIENNFSVKLSDKNVIKSDKLHQREKYYALWSLICDSNYISIQNNAEKLIENIGKSHVNIILNKSDHIRDSIRYFIDVNLKGKQLDDEDIFKSYLFKNDQSDSIRNEWYKLKTNVEMLKDNNIDFSILELLKYYLYCDLYKDPKYKGLEFGDNFLLRKEFKTKEDPSQTYRQGTHIIELIGSKKYMLDSISMLNSAIECMIVFSKNSPSSSEFKNLFICEGKRLDDVEYKIIHNLVGKILRDKKTLPKALVLKYIIHIIDYNAKSKNEYLKIYGVYLLSVLFHIFENKKSRDVLLSVLKANSEEWYNESVNQIKSYFSPDKITDTRLSAQYKLTANETEEDFRFRCKSLATVYNYFLVENNEVKIRKNQNNNLLIFITSDNDFSTEHFIVSDTDTKQTKIEIGSETKKYNYNDSFYNRHVNGIFNFIFISQSMNSALSNYWLPTKIKKINSGEYGKVTCEYSKMVLDKTEPLAKKMESLNLTPDNYINSLDLFFSRDFQDEYIKIAKEILKDIINRINGK